MNAMTYPDRTVYPFATENATDFLNLLDVYADATLRPNLNHLDFLQEGTGIGWGQGQEQGGGAMADGSSVFSEQFRAALFAHPSPYHWNSGGLAHDIRSLDHDELLAFHRLHYHPSRARFVLYGDLPLEPSVERLNNVLQHAPPPPPPDNSADSSSDALLHSLMSSPRRTSPIVLRVDGPMSSHAEGATAAGSDSDNHDSRQCKTITGWLTNQPHRDAYQTFCWSLLSSLLLSGPNAPLHRALLDEADVGMGWASYTGYDARHFYDAPFAVGLNGVRPRHAELVESMVLDVLRAHTRQPFSADRVDSVLHSVELGLRQRSARFGMSLISAVLPSWLHGDQWHAPLLVDQHLERFRREPRHGADLFADLIASQLLDNPHRVTVIQRPSPDYTLRQSLAEHAWLARCRAAPPPPAPLLAAFKERQSSGQDGVDCLPTLTMDDVPKQARNPTELTRMKTSDTSPAPAPAVWSTIQATGGIEYASVLLLEDDDAAAAAAAAPSSVSSSSPSALSLPLFASLWGRLATTQGHDHREVAQLTEGLLGGFSCSPFVSHRPDDPGRARRGVRIDASWLQRNREPALALIHEMVRHTDWRSASAPVVLRETLQAQCDAAQDGLVHAGHHYAMTRAVAAAVAGPAELLTEQWGGLTQLGWLQTAVDSEKRSATGPDQLLESFANTCSSFLSASTKVSCRLVVPQQADARSLTNELHSILTHQNTPPQQQQQQQQAPASSPGASPASSQQYHVLPVSDVHFVSQAMATGLGYSHPDFAPLSVACAALNPLLHAVIREQGGAYGSGAVCRPGSVSFYSYRDPHSLETADQFARTVADQLPALSDRELSEAKLSVFQRVDAPVAPADRGVAQFERLIGPAEAAQHRQRLLAVDMAAVHRVARQYFAFDQASTVILGPQSSTNQLESADWTIHHH